MDDSVKVSVEIGYVNCPILTTSTTKYTCTYPQGVAGNYQPEVYID